MSGPAYWHHPRGLHSIVRGLEAALRAARERDIATAVYLKGHWWHVMEAAGAPATLTAEVAPDGAITWHNPGEFALRRESIEGAARALANRLA